jgi:hypothetical protein
MKNKIAFYFRAVPNFSLKKYKMKNLVFFIFLIAVLFLADATAQNAITVGAWEMHRGIGDPIIDFPTTKYGDPAAYAKMNIPAADHADWTLVPRDPSRRNTINFKERSRLAGRLEQVDFTYFQTEVFIPKDVKVNTFTVSLGQADDGARFYFFNSRFPNGTFDPTADYSKADEGTDNEKKYASVNLTSKVVPGEINRVVVVQFDNCIRSTTVSGINLKINGESIPSEDPPCGKFGMIGHWTFDGSNNLIDHKGNFADLKLNGATVVNGALKVGDNAWAEASDYSGIPFNNKTMVAWIRINPAPPLAATLFSVKKSDGTDPNSIMMGSFNGGKWLPATDSSPQAKSSAPTSNSTAELVRVAVTYRQISSKEVQVKVYRNGSVLQEYIQETFPTYEANAKVLFGIVPTNEMPVSCVETLIDEAQIYNGVLCLEDIMALKPTSNIIKANRRR